MSCPTVCLRIPSKHTCFACPSAEHAAACVPCIGSICLQTEWYLTVQMMLVPRLAFDEDPILFSAHNRSATPCTDGGDCPADSMLHAVELPWDDDQQAFSTCIVIPRVLALEVVARSHSAAPWRNLLQLQVCSGPRRWRWIFERYEALT